MQQGPRVVTCSAVALALAIAARLVVAGPLDPPAGPVTSTSKTLAETEPRVAINAANTPGSATALYRITQPGSYYLTGNINGVSGKCGIEIASANVSIDLRGFSVKGVAGSLDGIVKDAAPRNNLRVCNGAVSDWGGDGVNLALVGLGNGAIVENLLVSGNTGAGIRAPQASIVRDCSVSKCGSVGISVATASQIIRCIAANNSQTGISAAAQTQVFDSQAFLNAVGIQVSSSCVVRGCIASSNVGDGIILQAECVAMNNLASVNGLRGIHALGPGNTIDSNTLAANATGIDLDVGECVAIRNVVSNNLIATSIVAGNTVGPFVTGATITASTNPHANYLP